MSTPAGWYDDPTRGGRQRYWDGGQWTEWVAENGQTVSEPIGAPVAPARGTPTGAFPVPEGLGAGAGATPGLQAAPGVGGWSAPAGAGTGARSGTYPMTLIGRIGFALMAIAGVLAAVSANQEATRSADGLRGYDTDATVVVLGIILVVVAAAGAILKPWIARVIAIVVGAGIVGFLALFLVGAKTGDAFISGDDVDVKTAWWLICIGAIIGLVGVVLAALFVTEPARRGGGEAPVASSKPVLSLVLSLVGLLVAPLGAGGAAIGVLGKRDVDGSGGRLKGGGLALAGIVIGLLATVAWLGGLIIAAFVAGP